MSAALLAQMRSLGVTIAADGDNLTIRPASKLAPELRAQLRAAKPELLALLRTEAAAQPSAPQPPDPLDSASPPPAVPLWAPPPPRAPRQPSWSDMTDIPTAADTCSCCLSRRWWTEATAPKGWRCARCHPPSHLRPEAVRHEPPPRRQGGRPS
jgi:hypothetical protein